MNYRLLNVVPLPALLIDRNGKILFVNSALVGLLRKFNQADPTNQILWDAVPVQYLQSIQSCYFDALRDGSVPVVSREITIPTPDGDLRFFLRALWNDEQNCLCVVIDDNTTLSQRISSLLHDATIDPLTGLFNRRAFHDHVQPVISTPTPYGVLTLDIDFFKKVNDTYGHDAGDVVLREVATRCRSQIRNMDVLARFGGEEFTIFLPAADADTLRAVGERIRRSVETAPVALPDGQSISCTLSIGGALRDGDGRDGLERSLKNADKELYRAKQDGRNRCYVAE